MQINHAGDGGLYPEMVRDRSFEAMAAYPAAKAYANDSFTYPAHNASVTNNATAAQAKSLQGWVAAGDSWLMQATSRSLRMDPSTAKP